MLVIFSILSYQLFSLFILSNAKYLHVLESDRQLLALSARLVLREISFVNVSMDILFAAKDVIHGAFTHCFLNGTGIYISNIEVLKILKDNQTLIDVFITDNITDIDPAAAYQNLILHAETCIESETFKIAFQSLSIEPIGWLFESFKDFYDQPLYSDNTLNFFVLGDWVCNTITYV